MTDPFGYDRKSTGRARHKIRSLDRIEIDQPGRPLARSLVRLVAGASTKPAPNPYRRAECVRAQGEQMPLIQLFDMGVRTLRGSDVPAAPTAASLFSLRNTVINTVTQITKILVAYSIWRSEDIHHHPLRLWRKLPAICALEGWS
jgi:hypothetical protein